MSDASGSHRWSLAAVDGIALIAFVLLGIRAHRDVAPVAAFARNVVPLAIAWTATALAIGTYRRPRLRTLVATWAVAVPIGLVARSLWVGSPTGLELVAFLAVALAFTLLFLLVGRAIVSGYSQRRPERGSISP